MPVWRLAVQGDDSSPDRPAPDPGRCLPGGPVRVPPRCPQADAARAALPPCAARAGQPSTVRMQRHSPPRPWSGQRGCSSIRSKRWPSRRWMQMQRLRFVPRHTRRGATHGCGRRPRTASSSMTASPGSGEPRSRRWPGRRSSTRASPQDRGWLNNPSAPVYPPVQDVCTYTACSGSSSRHMRRSARHGPPPV